MSSTNNMKKSTSNTFSFKNFQLSGSNSSNVIKQAKVAANPSPTNANEEEASSIEQNTKRRFASLKSISYDTCSLSSSIHSKDTNYKSNEFNNNTNGRNYLNLPTGFNMSYLTKSKSISPSPMPTFVNGSIENTFPNNSNFFF